MEVLIAIAVLAGVLVVPVMIGAKIVNARNTGFGSALVAVILMSIFSAGVGGFIGNDLIAFVASVAVGAMVLAGVLGTTFFGGLAISVIATVIQLAVLFVLAGSAFAGVTPAA